MNRLELFARPEIAKPGFSITLLIFFLSLSGFAQPLRDINYEYLYNPEAPFTFHLTVARTAQNFHVLYSLQSKDTVNVRGFLIQWEGRTQLGDREGPSVNINPDTITRSSQRLSAHAVLSIADAPQILVAKVINLSLNRAWIFFEFLDRNEPVNNFLISNGNYVHSNYLKTDQPVTLGQGSGEWSVSYYRQDFPAAAPIFSEAQARVSKGMEIDSVFYIKASDQLSFSNKGLYLIQHDTSSLEGLAFRVESDYPQFTRLANLAGPLMYICTRQEYDRLEAARDNKKTFDRIILNMVGDTERARTLMRSYFRRVEAANRLFTSYKEGWKTDRGMVYIIFGPPEEVYRFNDREVWNYKNDQFALRLAFVKSGSLFDPENYVLLREKKYEPTWYEVVDLWRNARF